MKVYSDSTITLMASPWDDSSESIWITTRTRADVETVYKSFRILKLIKP